jgi:methionyl-tRNA synthetase
MPSPAKKFFLTTPIYYVNARPHIGHAYTTIAADVIARRHRLLGEDTFFLTGTDEHGQKVQRSAAAAGIPPQQFADEVSASFQDLWKRMGILDDSLSKDDPLLHRDFLRTTEPRHHRGVQHLWRELEARGAIYLSSYTGQYCVSDEAFVDVPVGAPCPTCGRTTETITEENYFFRLSDYQLPLIDLIESGALHIQPETARNEVLSFLRGGLKDLSISRTSFTWGIPVPSSESVIPTLTLNNVKGKGKNPRISPEMPQKPAEKHVVYVWLDALANYITAIGYGSDDPAEQAKFARYWPADLHLVGKEITRFHCVYWPAFLLALNPATPIESGAPQPALSLSKGLDSETWVPDRPQLSLEQHRAWAKKMLPKSIVANGWLLFEESKMSKSRGNIVRTETILDAFGPLCPPVPVLKGTGFSPSETEPEQCAALAAEGTLTQPTNAQQDLFASDVLRYFLLREIPFGHDGSFSFDALITRYNADLANGYGNLVSRTLSMIGKYFDGFIPSIPRERPGQEKLIEAMAAASWVQAPYEFHESLTNIWVLITDTDRYINSWKPWKLADDADQSERLAEVLYSAAEFIRVITARLYPFLPYATASVWRQLGLGDIEEAARNGELKDLQWGGLKPGTKLGPLAPIFPRADKGLAQIMTDMESPTTPAAQTTPAPEPAAAPTPEKSDASVASVLSSSPGETSTISIDDFAKVDLRVAQIVVAERVPKTDKLLRLEVDLGPSFNPSRRQILAGIAEHYAPEALIGRKVVIVANLAPRMMRGLESQGMVVAASVGPNGAPVLAGFLEDAELGARLK